MRFVALALVAVSSANAQYLVPQVGKCRGTPDVSITLGKQNQSIFSCINKCMNDEKCTGMQFSEPKFCDLYYSNIKKIVEGDEGVFCGRKSKDCGDDSSFIFGSYEYDGVSVSQDCAWLTSNAGKTEKRLDQWCPAIVGGAIVASKCADTCGMCAGGANPISIGCSDSNAYSFGTYEWNGETIVQNCAWITANPSKTAKRQSDWCGEKKNGSFVGEKCPEACGMCGGGGGSAPVEPPVAAPVAKPVAAPVEPPVAAPVAKPVVEECNLVATLGFPIDSPDEAPYYGYHADYMEVTKVGDDENECSWTNSENLPFWCTYKNSNAKGDSAYISNIDDEYDDKWEALWTETIKIKKAAGNSYKFAVSHWFLDKDYYPDDAKWMDHLMSAILHIENKSHASQGSLKKNGWSHPVEPDVPTHIKKNGQWIVNPKYEGKFVVTVSCNNNCYCQSSYKVL